MHNASADRPHFVGIAGSGAVAQALGRALRDCGVPIACVASRDTEHAARAAAFIGGGTVPVRYGDLPSYASHLIIAVSDRAIPLVAEEIARAESNVRVALHTCGGYGPEILSPLADAGVSCGCLHPLQTLRDPGQGVAAIRVAPFAVCGDDEALCWAKEIAGTVSGQAILVEPESRALYHAAAVMASNYLVAVLNAAERLMTLAGVPPDEALRALGPLVRTTVDNVFESGTVPSLTGPVVRGDAATVARHLHAIELAEESVADLYRSAGRHALQIARQRGLSEDDARRVELAILGRE